MLSVSQEGLNNLPPEIKAAPVRFDAAAIRDALRHDEEFFIQFFLGTELTFPVPQFHKTSFRLLISSSVSRIALALPRGHAKTTLAKLAVVWYFLFSQTRFMVYVSNTATIAQSACVDIIEFMESPNFRAVFGTIEWERKRAGDGFYVFKLGQKRCILRALGAGQQVRGINIDNQRPELAVVDDLEDDENTATPNLQEKLKQWVYGPFKKALTRQHKMIWLGNMLSNKSLLFEHCKSKYWHSMQFGCLLSDGKPLWPDLWPLDAIQVDFAEYKQLGLIPRWFAEMMNQPIPGSAGLIQENKIIYAPIRDPDEIRYGFITLDPAISQKSWADDTAIVAHGYVDDRWQILDEMHDKMGIDDIYKNTMSMCFRWGLHVVGIEMVAYQASLKYIFEYFNQLYHFDNVNVVELVGSGRKHERIRAWVSELHAGVYSLTEGDFTITQQLLMFNPNKRENVDDVIDSCAYGPQMINNYLGLIMQEQGPNLNKPAGEISFCAV